jgi:hypothetical protein
MQCGGYCVVLEGKKEKLIVTWRGQTQRVEERKKETRGWMDGWMG